MGDVPCRFSSQVVLLLCIKEYIPFLLLSFYFVRQLVSPFGMVHGREREVRRKTGGYQIVLFFDIKCYDVAGGQRALGFEGLGVPTCNHAFHLVLLFSMKMFVQPLKE